MGRMDGCFSTFPFKKDPKQADPYGPMVIKPDPNLKRGFGSGAPLAREKLSDRMTAANYKKCVEKEIEFLNRCSPKGRAQTSMGFRPRPKKVLRPIGHHELPLR